MIIDPTHELMFINSVLENAGALIVVLDRDGKILRFNKACEELSEFKLEEVLGKTPWETVIPPEFGEEIRRDVFDELVKKHNSTLNVKINQWMSKSGKRFLIEWHNKVICDDNNETKFVIALGLDITKKQITAQKQKRTSELLSSIIENIPNMLFLKDAKELRFEIFNKAGEDLLGFSRHELIGKNDYDFFPKEQADFFTKKDREVLEGVGYLDIPEEVVTNRSNQRIVLHTKKIALRDENGNPDYLLGISEDITARKQNEEAMRQSQQRYVSAIDSLNRAQEIAHIGSWILDLKTKSLEWSDEVFRIFGHKPQAFAPTYESFLNAVHLDDREQVIQAVNSSLQHNSPYFMPHRVVRPDGELVYVEENGKVYFDDQGLPSRMIGTVHDVTDRKKVEDELQAYRVNLEKLVDIRTKELLHASRLAALGEMAAGIAHEINNPLGIIMGKASLMAEKISVDQPDDKETCLRDLSLIISTSERISKIVHGLRFFSRSGEKDPQRVVNLKDIVSDTLVLCLERFHYRNIKVSTQFKDEGSIKCSPTQIGQVVLNLLNNAYDAICDKPSPWISIQVESIKKKVILRIIDSGAGIPKADQDKIMQPFFTTKAIGKGTGLGLSISKGIIEDHDGRLWLDKEHANTCFVVELPQAVESVARKQI